MSATPFDNLESAQDYVALLRSAVVEAQDDIRCDIATTTTRNIPRHLQGLRLVDLTLTQLGAHLRSASGILNDLRMLRRVLATGSNED